MPHHRPVILTFRGVWLALAILVPVDESRAQTRPALPLFASTEPVELRLEAPFDRVFGERTQNSDYHPARIRVDDRALAAEVKTRGKFRLRRATCDFPPLRLRLDSADAIGTIFEGQRALKLVTHCRTGRTEYEQYVLKEYLLYRTYASLTDLSFRARLARITYVDIDQAGDAVEAWAFFIEDDDAMAARNGWTVLRVPVVPPRLQDPEQLGLVDLFEYMIGNTDWNYFIAARDENECCHNARIIGSPQGPVFPVPYDFDFSGVVDARYAKPDERLPIRTVRDRYYMGLCRSPVDFQGTVARFRAREAEITRLWLTQPGLEPETRDAALAYLADFYELLSDPEKMVGEFRDTCRRLTGD